MIQRKLIVIVLFLCFSLLSSCSNSETFLEEDILVVTGEYQMEGKLTLPSNSKSPVPAVILVGGSGPTNMNSAVGKLHPFQDIAEGLAKQGIATIRYNKRTFQYQSSLATKYMFSPQDEYVDDALHAIDILLADERIDNENIFLIGHSQGGQFAPVIANQTQHLKGIVIMAGITAHILDLLMDQVLKNHGEEQYDAYYPYYEVAKEINALDATKYNHHYFGAYYHYWLAYNQIDFEEELLACAQNHLILVMQGGKDIQVYESYYERYQELLPETTYNNVWHTFFPDLNHLFVDGKDETIQTAYSVEANVEQQVIDEIVQFVRGANT